MRVAGGGRGAGRTFEIRILSGGLGKMEMDPETHPAEEVADLYLWRWEIEVKLRDPKTTLRMEMLRVKRFEMAERTLLMMQISYNLIRALMQEGANHGVREILEISFKQTIDLVVSMSESYRPLAGKPRKL